MSGSPKYSIFDLEADVGQMLKVNHDKAMKSHGLNREKEEKRIREEREHQQQVEMAYNLRDHREQQRVESLLLSEKVSDRIAVLKLDTTIMQWMNEEVRALENKLVEISVMIDRDEFAASQTFASALLQKTEDIVQKAEVMQLYEDRRQYVIQGIMDVMEDMGFIIQAGYPAPEYPNTPSSATIIQAARLGGGDIALSIPQQGEVWYEVNGFPMQMEEGGAGAAVYKCDEAEKEIGKIHNMLRESYGIQMGELRWEGKDPNRIKKAADCLTIYRGTEHRRMNF
jgi:hypothetical protein